METVLDSFLIFLKAFAKLDRWRWSRYRNAVASGRTMCLGQLIKLTRRYRVTVLTSSPLEL